MLKIGDFSKLSKVAVKTLRYYDEIGLLKPDQVAPFTGYRYYSADQLPRLNNILILKDLGLSLEQIDRVLRENISADEIRRVLRLRRVELEGHIREEQGQLARVDAMLRQFEIEGKTANHYELFSTRRQQMLDLKIPDGPEAITPEWLTQALKSTNTINGAIVSSCDTTPVGSGLTGRMARVELEYEKYEEGVPRSLYAKFPPADAALLERWWSLQKNEIRFYQEIAGEIELRTPRFYYSAKDPEIKKSIFLLEDLAPAHQGDSLAGCSIEEAKLVLNHLAKFQAGLWESLRLKTWLSPMGVTAEVYEHFPTMWDVFVEKYSEGIPTAFLSLGEKLKGNLGNVLDRVLQGPHTFVHFLFRPRNLFFYDSKEDAEIAVINWQFFAHGSPLWDVASFLAEGLDTEDRRENESELLKIYHSALEDHGVKGFGFDQLMKGYRLSILGAWYWIVFNMVGMVSIDWDSVDDGLGEFATLSVKRNCEAVLDHFSDDLITD